MIKKSINPVKAAVGLAFLGSSLAAPVFAASGENPFVMNDLGSGYQVAAKDGEGKCGEAKCGEGIAKEVEGNCGEKADKAAEGSCGESSAKSSEGTCGDSAKAPEGSCGEGKN